MFTNLCRLCLGTDDLLWVFDEKLTDNMTEIIKVTSGVEISKTDSVTQMVCSTCCQITIKMYKFRTTSIKNDKDLKAQCAGYNVSRLTTTNATCKKDILIPPVTPTASIVTTPTCTPVVTTVVIKPTPIVIPLKYKFAHASIKEVVKKNPKIQLPDNCLKSHVGAYITLLTDEVDEWFKEKNYTDEQIENLKQEAFDLTNPKRKANENKRKSKDIPESKINILKKPKLSNPPVVTRMRADQEIIKQQVRKVNSMTENITSKSNVLIVTRTSADQGIVKQQVKNVNSMTENITSNSEARAASPTNGSKRMNLTKEPLLKPKSRISRRIVSSDSERSMTSSFEQRPVSPTNSSKRVNLSSEASSRPKSRASTNRIVSSESEKSVTLNSDPKLASSTNSSNRINVTSGRAVRPKSRISMRIVSSGSDNSVNADDPMPSIDSDSEYVPDSTQQSDNSTPNSSDKSVMPKSIPNSSDKLVTSDVASSSDLSVNIRNQNVKPPSSQKEKLATSSQGDLPGNSNAKSSILSSLLATDTLIPQREEITITTILKSTKEIAAKPIQADDVIEIDDAPSPNNNRAKRKTPPGTRVGAEEDELLLFSSRPFLHQKKKENKSPGDTVILSDSEDAPSASKNPENSSDSDPIVVDIDSGSCSSSSTKSKENSNKTSFAHALELTPKGTDSTNTPDFSLLSVANKSYTLYTCKVCDSQHSSLKDLKQHEKRTHTKCPFCNKRFRTLANRDEHVKNSCSINKSPVELKPFKLELTRIDEDEDIRKKYPRAFDVLEEKNDLEPTEPKETEQVTIDLIKDMDKFLTSNEVLNINDESENDKTGDVICISDEESETRKESAARKLGPKIKLVNNDIVKNINIHLNEANILKEILLRKQQIRAAVEESTVVLSMETHPIVDGHTNRTKVFKNLRKYLQRYKIPIEVSYNPTVSVHYKQKKVDVAPKLMDLWGNMEPKNLRPLLTPKTATPPVTTQYTVLNGQTVDNLRSLLKPQAASQMINCKNMMSQPQSFKTVQDSVVSTTNLMLASTCTVSSAPVSCTPVVLNGTPNFTNATTKSNITNFILVPSTMVSANVTLPATQGPLPVIESVASAVEVATSSNVARLESITNSLMPISNNALIPINTNAVMAMTNGIVSVNNNRPAVTVGNIESVVEPQPQPAIRVKNLKELS